MQPLRPKSPATVHHRTVAGASPTPPHGPSARAFACPKPHSLLACHPYTCTHKTKQSPISSEFIGQSTHTHPRWQFTYHLGVSHPWLLKNWHPIFPIIVFGVSWDFSLFWVIFVSFTQHKSCNITVVPLPLSSPQNREVGMKHQWLHVTPQVLITCS